MFEKYIKLLTYKRKSSSSPILSSYSARFSIKPAKFHYTPLPSLRSIPEKATIQLKESERGSKQDLRRRLCTPFPFTATDMSGALRRSVQIRQICGTKSQAEHASLSRLVGVHCSPPQFIGYVVVRLIIRGWLP